MGWRDGSGVKNADFSSKDPEFNSQQPSSGVYEDSYNVLTYNNK